MTKIRLMLIITVILGLIVILTLFFRRSSGPVFGSPPGIKTTPSPSPDYQAQTGRFKSFLAFTVPQTCSFDSVAASVSGRIYLNNGKIRAEINLSPDVSTVSAQLIYIDSTSYVWVTGQDSGYRLNYKSAISPLTKGESPIDPNLEVNYSCFPWTPDNTFFVPPKTVKFADFSSRVAPTTLPSGNADKCDSCNGLEGQLRTNCLIILRCRY